MNLYNRKGVGGNGIEIQNEDDTKSEDPPMDEIKDDTGTNESSELKTNESPVSETSEIRDMVVLVFGSFIIILAISSIMFGVILTVRCKTEKTCSAGHEDDGEEPDVLYEYKELLKDIVNLPYLLKQMGANFFQGLSTQIK